MALENGIHKKEGYIFNISDYLKQLREKKGVSLEEAVNTLKISYDYLKAFEEGGFGSLPKDTYTRIFLRVYTEYLGGDVKEVMAGFAEFLPEKSSIKVDQNIGEKSKIRFDSKNWVKNVPFNPKLIWIVVIVVIIIYMGLFCGRKQKEPSKEISFEEKEFSKVDIKEPEQQKPKSENENIVGADYKSALTKKLVLKAKALEDVNLEMVVDDKITIKEIMKKDESRIWTAKENFRINTDNIGALDFTFNDERFGVLGELGESRTGICFPPVKEQ